MWVSRRQAQNAADASALAAAISLIRDPAPDPEAKEVVATLSAQQWAAANAVWGGANSSANVQVAYSEPGVNIAPCGEERGCVRVDVYRNQPDRSGTLRGAPLPTYFASIAGVTQQGVRATATAEVGSGNQVKCLLPFGVIDRWADNNESVAAPFYPNDALSGIAGWSMNDLYESALGDVYIPPYDGNTNHTGWRIATDYGRQMVIKGDKGQINPSWAQVVCLDEDNCGGGQVRDWIENCDPTPIGVASAAQSCPTGAPVDPAHGCLVVKPGHGLGNSNNAIDDEVALDPAAHWDPTAAGPNGAMGAVVGGGGMASTRIRPIAIVDIGAFDFGCNGRPCRAKVANILGFFIEGSCEGPHPITMDPPNVCENKDIIGRLVTLPGRFASSTGTIEDDAAFIQVIRLVR
jgi:hypothetical protein